MPPNLLSAIDDTLLRARASGALLPIRTQHTTLLDTGRHFQVRWLSTLAEKDAARVTAAGRREAGFNPFLPPEPALTVGPVGDAHWLILNKYPVIDHHLLIVTREFEAQTAPLTCSDFAALAAVLNPLGGLGFYNGGREAGASQPHKHLQWIPAAAQDGIDMGFNLQAFTSAADTEPPPHLPWRHGLVDLTASGIPQALTGKGLLTAFHRACIEVGLAPDADTLAPYNLLVTRTHLLVVPRQCEHYQDISVNALGFAGSLFVRRPEQVATIQQIGPLALLSHVAIADAAPGILSG